MKVKSGSEKCLIVAHQTQRQDIESRFTDLVIGSEAVSKTHNLKSVGGRSLFSWHTLGI